MLCSCADKDWSDRSGLKVLDLLKEVLADPTEELPGCRRKIYLALGQATIVSKKTAET